jgi:hypothetical protein
MILPANYRLEVDARYRGKFHQFRARRRGAGL